MKHVPVRFFLRVVKTLLSMAGPNATIVQRTTVDSGTPSTKNFVLGLVLFRRTGHCGTGQHP